MNQKEAGQLLDKYLQGKASQHEETIVQSWLMNQTAYNQMDKSETEYPLPPEMWNNISESIHQKRISLWPRIGLAAAVATIIFGAGLFYYKKQQKEIGQTMSVANDISPGRQGATLTLASGKKIGLGDAANGELAKEAGVVITKSANGQLVYEINGSETESNKINTLSTAKGETYQVRLPDGSLVWLNAASSLTYSANLTERGKRRVRLDGEGYFEIAKDKEHPFIVNTNKQTIEVLGTHFNINSYPDEAATKTTLLEGSVHIVSLNGVAEAMLKPNQQAILKGTSLQVIEVDSEVAVAWKNGIFMFDRENLRSIMNQISRWYDVEVIYEDDINYNQVFAGSISKFKKISQALEILELTKTVKFKIEGRKVTVMK